MQALEGLPGVKKAHASHPEKRAVVTYVPALVTPEQMCRALLKAGYVASPSENRRATQVDGENTSRETGGDRTDRFVCYCFEYTEEDIRQDLAGNGRSVIMEKITAEKKAGGCDCAEKNPKGR